MAEPQEKGLLKGVTDNAESRVVHAADVATDLLRKAVVGGELPPGQTLREAVIAEELGISRTPVRTALQRLSAEGLVDLKPGRSARVKTFEVGEIEELYDVRTVLEGHAAALAAKHISPDQLEELRRSCGRFEEMLKDSSDEHLAALVDEDVIFHSTISEASGNKRLAATIKDVASVPLAYKAFYWNTGGDANRQRSRHDHREILAAIEAGDSARAEALMREHIAGAGDVLTEAFAAS